MNIFEQIADAAEKLLDRVEKEEQAAHLANRLAMTETWQETTDNAYHRQVAGEAVTFLRVKWKATVQDDQ